MSAKVRGRRPGSRQGGYLLVEAMMTMVLVTLGLMILGQLLAVGAVSTVENRYQEVATRVAQQFLERAKGMNFKQLTPLCQGQQPTPHDVFVRLANAQIVIDQAPLSGDNIKYMPTGVTYSCQAGTPSSPGQVAISVDVGYVHRGITRHVFMTTTVLDNGR